jgi:hypothetical protein
MPNFSLSDHKTLFDVELERFASALTHNIAEGEVSKADIQATTQEFEHKMMSIHDAGLCTGNHPCLK